MKGLSTFLPSSRCEAKFCTLFSRKNTSIVIKSAQNISIVVKKIAKRMALDYDNGVKTSIRYVHTF